MQNFEKRSLKPQIKANLWKWIFHRLFDFYGSQGWWPVTCEGECRPAYHPGQWAPLSLAQQFEVWMGAILTQNTSWNNVEKALIQLRRKGIRTPEDLVLVPLVQLEHWILPTGYYRQKSRRLMDISMNLLKLGGLETLNRMDPVTARNLLLSWKGIGPETADSILLYAMNHSFFVVDAYTRRLGLRMGLSSQTETYPSLQSEISRKLPALPDVYGEFHALIVAHVKSRCTARSPRCTGCPLLCRCLHGKLSGVASHACLSSNGTDLHA